MTNFPVLRRALRIAGLSTGLLLTTACINSRGGSIPYDVQNFRAPDAPQAPAVGASYRIASGDTLTVTVFQVTDLSREYVVDASGHIAMPLIGNVPAAGQTSEQLRQAIATRLNARYLRNADVTVAVREATGQFVSVDGAVRRPGQFPVRGPTTLLQTIALAGGSDPSANPRRVAIFRQVDGQRMAAAFDLTAIRRGQAPDPQVYAGDVVVMDGNQLQAAWQQVLQTLPLISIFRPF